MAEARALVVDLENWEAAGPELSSRSPQPAKAGPYLSHTEAERTAELAEPDDSGATLYQGPLHVVIQAPVYPAALGGIYERLGQLPNVTLRDTRKADDGSYVINLSLGDPTPLVSVLKHLDKVAEVSVGPPAMDVGVRDGTGEPESVEGRDAAPGTSITVRLKE